MLMFESRHIAVWFMPVVQSSQTKLTFSRLRAVRCLMNSLVVIVVILENIII